MIYITQEPATTKSGRSKGPSILAHMEDDDQTHGKKVSEGMRRARAAGVRLGRPKSTKEGMIEDLLKAGWPAVRIRRELRVGTEVVQRVKNRLREEAAPKKKK